MTAPHDLRILHVEDDDGDARLVGRMLSELSADIAIERARDGSEALGLLEAALDSGRHLPDVVVLDLHMPVLDGEGFLTALRADARFDEVAVVVLTSERDLATLKRLSRLGAQALLSKDRNEDEFRALKQFVIDLWFHGHADPLALEIALQSPG